jgi:hypothetical protein
MATRSTQPIVPLVQLCSRLERARTSPARFYCPRGGGTRTNRRRADRRAARGWWRAPRRVERQSARREAGGMVPGARREAVGLHRGESNGTRHGERLVAGVARLARAARWPSCGAAIRRAAGVPDAQLQGRACSASGCRRAWRHRGHRVQRRGEHRGRPGTDKLAGAARFNRREAAATGRSSRHGWWRRAGLVPKTERGGGSTYLSMPTVAAGSSDPRNTCMESSRVGSAQSACSAVAILAAAPATPAGAARAERLVREQRWCGSRWRANFKDGRRRIACFGAVQLRADACVDDGVTVTAVLSRN